ncbi:MAG TPA: immune inhibitor A, partial [Saprospiraceae bacterium]|nr:immune inhibitor A [Saprospiraceae bacterium]
KYANSQRNDLTFSNFTLSIPPGARQPLLRFWAKWDIEDNRDYAAVFVESLSGDMAALCGRYTNTGATAQGGGDFPVYDGLQATWVEECMDLSDFIGESFSLRFRMLSGAQNQFDGFYFDDLRVEYIDPTVLKTVTLPLQDFDLRQNEPNPATGFTAIAWQDRRGSGDQSATLQVSNALGQPVLSLPLDLGVQQQTTLDVRTWPAGTYTYFIRAEHWQSPTRQMVVLK